MTDHHDDADNTEQQPSFPKITGQIIAATAAVVGVAGSIIAFLLADRLLYRIGLFMIVIGVAVVVGAIGFQIMRNGKLYGLFRRWGRLLAVAGSCVIIVAGAVIVATEQPGSTASCEKTAQVSGADTTAKNFNTTVYLHCLAPSSNSLYLVVQDLDEGKKGTPKHSEYYLAWAVKNSLGQQSFNDSPHGCVPRRFYVISVTQDQLELIQSSPRAPGGGYYSEPVDTYMEKYIWSNVQMNHSCNAS